MTKDKEMELGDEKYGGGLCRRPWSEEGCRLGFLTGPVIRVERSA